MTHINRLVQCDHNKIGAGAVFFLIFTLLSLAGQTCADDDKEIENLFVADCYYTCPDIIRNCIRLIPQYYEDGKYDTVSILLDYWEESCGRMEETYRLRLLMAIREHRQMAPVDCNIGYLVSWGRSFHVIKMGSCRLEGYSIPPEFDSFTVRIARELERRLFNTPIDNLICRLYGGGVGNFFEELRSPVYAGTALQDEYLNDVQSVLDGDEFYFGLSTGIWVPTGHRSLLGSHPIFGTNLTYRIKKSVFGIGFSLGSIDSPGQCTIIEGNVVDTAKDFSLSALDFNYGYEFCRHRRHSLLFSLGIGYQDLTRVVGENNEEHRRIASMLGAVGLAYRLYVGSFASGYIELKPRVEFSRINTNGGSDLSGAAFAIKLSYGWDATANSWKRYRLKNLQYRF